MAGCLTTVDEAPPIPPRPSEEELSNTITHRLNPTSTDHQHHQVESDEWMNDDAAAKRKDANKEKMPPKVKGKKKNPFMPQLAPKAKVMLKKSSADPVEKKSLVEQLNELHLDQEEEEEDPESLMEWWSTVQLLSEWELVRKDEEMTEKEEAQAFAVTAERVQRGIRVFNRLYSERAEALWQHVIDLYAIADGLDRFNWRTKVAQVTGGSTSAVGGVATITGLALAPFTMGTSLIVTAVGLGVATAGGLTSASAGISNAVHDSLDRKKVERLVRDFQSKMVDIDKCTRFIKRGVENLRELNAPRVKKLKVYDQDFPQITNIYEDGAMASKAVLANANEIARVTQVAMATGNTAARAVQIASMATGVLSGLFIALDVYFVAKDSQALRKGAKSEFAKKIREVAEQLQQGLVELNSIRDELRSSGTSSFSNPISTSISSFTLSTDFSSTSTTNSTITPTITSTTITSTDFSSTSTTNSTITPTITSTTITSTNISSTSTSNSSFSSTTSTNYWTY